MEAQSVGLIAELTEYFSRQLDLTRSLQYERCPGEAKCAEVGRIRDIRSRAPDTPIDAICAACHLNETKPGNEPTHLTPAILTAQELDILHAGGATFAYPDALSPTEWICLKALQHARRIDQEREQQHRMQQEKNSAERARLEAIRRR